LCKAILQLLPSEGSVRFDGLDLKSLPASELRRLRRRMQPVFQSSCTSLDPRLTVASAVCEPMAIHRLCPRSERRARAVGLLAQVGLGPEILERFPHELSGGQRQRIGIARALALSPELLVADEPMSGLDCSVQAQVANVLMDLQERLGLAMLLVSHDLAMVAHLADRVAVMYLGKLVELGPALGSACEPLHPYSRALWEASSSARLPGSRVLEGEAPSPIDPPSGCCFHPRCPSAMDRCRAEEPTLAAVGEGHSVACWLAESRARGQESRRAG
jgi:oligopeptide/dipeptide ABC transporter ATP-binding protein